MCSVLGGVAGNRTAPVLKRNVHIQVSSQDIQKSPVCKSPMYTLQKNPIYGALLKALSAVLLEIKRRLLREMSHVAVKSEIVGLF